MTNQDICDLGYYTWSGIVFYPTNSRYDQIELFVIEGYDPAELVSYQAASDLHIAFDKPMPPEEVVKKYPYIQGAAWCSACDRYVRSDESCECD